MNLDKENVRRIRGLILFTVIMFLGIQRFDVILLILDYIWELLFPFVLGLCIAYLLNIPVRFIERVLFKQKKTKQHPIWRKLKRPISLLITFVLVLGVIAIVMFVVVPELKTTGKNLYNTIPSFMRDAQKAVESFIQEYPVLEEYLGGVELDWTSLTDTIVSFIKDDLVNTLSSTLQVAQNVMGTLLDILIAVFFSIYVLMQKERLARQAKAILSAFCKEKTRNTVIRIAKLADTAFANFFSGQCIEAVILGTMFVISMSIFNLPYAVMIGVLIAFTALIPLFGPLIGCIIGALLIFITSPIQAFWFVVLFCVLQLLEENLIYPHVVGNAVGLPPMWVLAAVAIGGTMFGIAGMLFFIPLTSVLYALFRELVYAKIKKKREKGELPPANLEDPLLEKDAAEEGADQTAAANAEAGHENGEKAGKRGQKYSFGKRRKKK